MSFQNGREFLVFDLMVVFAPAPPATMSGVTPFLDLHQRHLDSQPAVREHAGEMD